MSDAIMDLICRIEDATFCAEKAARAELAALTASAAEHRKAVLSEVREKMAKWADELRREGDHDSAELLNSVHDWTYDMETK